MTGVINALQDPLRAVNNVARLRMKGMIEEEDESKDLIDFYFKSILHRSCPVVRYAPWMAKESNNVILLAFRMICWFALHDFDPEDVRSFLPISKAVESRYALDELKVLGQRSTIRQGQVRIRS